MGLPLGFELIEGIRLAFLRHDVGREGNRWRREKHAKNDTSGLQMPGIAGLRKRFFLAGNRPLSA
jgi:hypothetical protein